MVRQYIGARYVTKAYENSQDPSSAEWETSMNYEPLTLVTYNYGSYLSKKEVPASVGDPASNPDYWTQTGFYNGQITLLNARVTKLEGEIFINTPENFGAVGNGIADDTSAVEDCINNSDIILFKNNYLITSTVTVPKGKILLGSDTGVITTDDKITIFNLAGDNIVDGLKFTDSLAPDQTIGICIYAKDTNNIEIKNCIFNTVGCGVCIELDHCTNSVIKNNLMKDYAFSGITLMHTCSFIDIEFNRIIDGRYTGSLHRYPITISGYTDYDYGAAHHIKCNYNYIENSVFVWDAIDSHGARNYEIIGNYIKGDASGISMGAKRTSSTDNFTDANCNSVIKDNYIEVESPNSSYTSRGVTVSGGSDVITMNLVIENNEIHVNNLSSITNPLASGIVLRPSGIYRDCKINGNIFDLKGNHGISLDGEFENIIMKGNYFKDINDTFYCFNLGSLDRYRDIFIEQNSVDPSATAGRFFKGNPSVTPENHRLIELKDNSYGSMINFDREYSTAIEANIMPASKLEGVTGQFIPSNSGTIAGWYCIDTGTWLAISGTSV